MLDEVGWEGPEQPGLEGVDHWPNAGCSTQGCVTGVNTVLINLFISNVGDGAECNPSQEGWVTHQRVVLLSTGASASWEAPEGQQGVGQSPAPEEEQPQAPGHAGAAWRETRKGPGGSGGHRVECEPGKCPGGKTWAETEAQEVPSGHQEMCFHWEAKHWHRSPRQDVKSPSLEILKTS